MSRALRDTRLGRIPALIKVFALAAMLGTAAGPALARGGGGGGHGGGWGGGGWHGGGWGWGGGCCWGGWGWGWGWGVGVGLYAPYWGYPYAAYPYSYPAYAYAPGYPAAAAPAYPAAAAPAYPAAAPPPAAMVAAPPPSQAESFWYYCRASKSYYPYVSSCGGPWQKVPTIPPQVATQERALRAAASPQ